MIRFIFAFFATMLTWLVYLVGVIVILTWIF